MPHAEIPNESPTIGIRTQTGPDDVLLTLHNAISSVASVAMYDAVGDAKEDETGELDFTIWNVWIQSHQSRSTADLGADEELTAIADQIQKVIREISPEHFSDYKFHTVTVQVGRHYNNV